MKRIARLGIILAFLPLTAGVNSAYAQTADTSAEISAAASKLTPIDYNFVAQANLGAPFQVDSGRIAEGTILAHEYPRQSEFYSRSEAIHR